MCLACLLVLADALGALASLVPVPQTPTKIDTFLALHSREGSGVLVQCSGTEHLNTWHSRGGLLTHGFQEEEWTSTGCGKGQTSWTSTLKQWVGIKRQWEQWVCGLNHLLWPTWISKRSSYWCIYEFYGSMLWQRGGHHSVSAQCISSVGTVGNLNRLYQAVPQWVSWIRQISGPVVLRKWRTVQGWISPASANRMVNMLKTKSETM